MSCYDNDRGENNDSSSKNINDSKQSEDMFDHFLKSSPGLLAQVSRSQSSDTTCTSIETDITDSVSDIVTNNDDHGSDQVYYPKDSPISSCPSYLDMMKASYDETPQDRANNINTHTQAIHWLQSH